MLLYNEAEADQEAEQRQRYYLMRQYIAISNIDDLAS